VTLPLPKDAPLKDPKAWTLIGTPQKRLDTPDKVRGKTVYGIDVQVPGMKIATVALCPALGGKVVQVADGAARKIAPDRLAQTACVSRSTASQTVMPGNTARRPPHLTRFSTVSGNCSRSRPAPMSASGGPTP
jgi:CO/xanthine dehydrogenase Mo-binding subunit